MHSPEPDSSPSCAARLQRSVATSTTCAFAALPCLALGFAAPAFAFAAVAGGAAIWGWAGLGRIGEQERATERVISERDRLFATERAQALRAEAAEMRLRRMGERVRELYFEYDAEARSFVYLSPVFEKLFGVESGSAYADSERVFERFDEARRQTLRAALVEGTEAERVRLEFKTPEGLLRRVSLTAEVDAGDARLVRGTLTLLRVGTGLALGAAPEPAAPLPAAGDSSSELGSTNIEQAA